MIKKKYSMKEIREMVIEKIKKNYPDVTIKDPEFEDEIELASKEDGKFSSKMYLSNIEKEVNNSGYDIDKAIEARLVPFTSVLNAKELENNIYDWNFVKDKIILVPQHKEYCESMFKNLGDDMKKELKDRKKEDTKLYSKPFVQDIVLVGAIDFPSHLAYVTTATMKKWGKTNVEVEEQMSTNLLKYQTKYRTDVIGGMIHIRATGGGVLSTFLIQPEKLRKIADENGLKGKEVVGVLPFRDLIMLSEHNMGSGIHLWGMASSMIRDGFMPYSISSKLFMIDKEGVISNFKSDELPGEGVVFAVDKKNHTMDMMPIGRKEFSLDSPSAEEMEEQIRNNPKLARPLFMAMAAEEVMERGFSAEDFFKFMVKNGRDREEVKGMIMGMINKGLLKLEKNNGEFRLYPTKETFEKVFGGIFDRINKNDGGKK